MCPVGASSVAAQGTLAGSGSHLAFFLLTDGDSTGSFPITLASPGLPGCPGPGSTISLHGGPCSDTLLLSHQHLGQGRSYKCLFLPRTIFLQLFLCDPGNTVVERLRIPGFLTAPSGAILGRLRSPPGPWLPGFSLSRVRPTPPSALASAPPPISGESHSLPLYTPPPQRPLLHLGPGTAALDTEFLVFWGSLFAETHGSLLPTSAVTSCPPSQA
jgi:hypothetical protein